MKKYEEELKVFKKKNHKKGFFEEITTSDNYLICVGNCMICGGSDWAYKRVVVPQGEFCCSKKECKKAKSTEKTRAYRRGRSAKNQ